MKSELQEIRVYFISLLILNILLICGVIFLLLGKGCDIKKSVNVNIKSSATCDRDMVATSTKETEI